MSDVLVSVDGGVPVKEELAVCEDEAELVWLLLDVPVSVLLDAPVGHGPCGHCWAHTP